MDSDGSRERDNERRLNSVSIFIRAAFIFGALSSLNRSCSSLFRSANEIMALAQEDESSRTSIRETDKAILIPADSISVT